jgi:hypothetical protein
MGLLVLSAGKDYVDTIFSCDFHFQKIGEEYKVKVVNPLDLWLLL